jgi:malate dehydrogenase (oxaloacetate-decarboxylating)(NADP+)
MKALRYHATRPAGKIRVSASKPCATPADLALAYTPGVARPALAIARRPNAAYRYTGKGNLVAVITNGTAVLGLGNIGPLAAKPVMEGKALLFKRLADIDAFDLEVDASEPDDLVRIVSALQPTFGGINLEDIRAPECFEVEARLQATLSIPVFHDDQHGTAIVVGAALLNGLHLADKCASDARVVICGAGAAGIACASMCVALGVCRERLMLIDSRGVVHTERPDLNTYKRQFAVETTSRTLTDAIVGADVFIGLSGRGLLTSAMLRAMARRPLVLALANPDPEIAYDVATATRTDVIFASGRSDSPNQVNNVLAFPSVFRAALDVRATSINQAMKLAASRALAALARESSDVSGSEALIPKPLDPRVLVHVAPAVARAADASGVARHPVVDYSAYAESLATRMLGSDHGPAGNPQSADIEPAWG